MKLLITIISLAFYFSLPIICEAQWTLQGTVTGVGYPDISVFNPTGLVVAGGTTGSPKVFKSTNSGVNWTDISGNMTGTELGCVWAVDGNLIFAGDVGAPGGAGGNAKVWKTTNGGTTWSVILSTGGTQGYFNGIVFSRTEPMIGIAQSDPPNPGDSFYVAKTTNGGNTWFTQSTISTGGYAAFNSVVCIDNLFYGWGSGFSGPRRVIFTTDGGVTWSIKDIGMSGAYVAGFAMSSDKTTGITVSNISLPTVSRSTDSGFTWTTLNTSLPVSSSIVSRVKWVYGTNYCYLTSEIGISGCVGKSTDAGITWSIMNTSGITDLFNIDLIYIGGTVYAYAINPSGQVIKLQEPIGIITINSNVPSGFRLEQNYPNPFNPSTKIRFSIPLTLEKAGRNVILAIYDILGKEITTLVNEELKPGTYEVEWDASSYTSGIYYYKLEASDFKETRKMVLIK
ncbi:MAG TPA: T9SS type A sorting domain-containing protein [Ignavibacteria bacterium]|jgi:hypothetical protein